RAPNSTQRRSAASSFSSVAIARARLLTAAVCSPAYPSLSSSRSTRPASLMEALGLSSSRSLATTAFIAGLPLSGDERKILRREDRVLVCLPAGERGCGVRPTRVGSASGAARRGVGCCLRHRDDRARPG